MALDSLSYETKQGTETVHPKSNTMLVPSGRYLDNCGNGPTLAAGAYGYVRVGWSTVLGRWRIHSSNRIDQNTIAGSFNPLLGRGQPLWVGYIIRVLKVTKTTSTVERFFHLPSIYYLSSSHLSLPRMPKGTCIHLFPLVKCIHHKIIINTLCLGTSCQV